MIKTLLLSAGVSKAVSDEFAKLRLKLVSVSPGCIPQYSCATPWG